VDERVVVDTATSVRSLIAVSEEPSASAVALVEPWACVESSYSTTNRRTLAPGGRLLVVVDDGHAAMGLAEAAQPSKAPAFVTIVAAAEVDCAWAGPDVAVTRASDVGDLPDGGLRRHCLLWGVQADDRSAHDKLAVGAIINVVLAGATIGAPVSVGVGRVHYEATRWIGTVGRSATESMRRSPTPGSLRAGDSVLAIGAAGPMGQMHILRSLSAGVDGSPWWAPTSTTHGCGRCEPRPSRLHRPTA